MALYRKNSRCASSRTGCFHPRATSNIIISVNCSEELKAAFDAHRDHIMSETLAKSLEYTDAALETYKLNGREAGIGVEKVEA